MICPNCGNDTPGTETSPGTVSSTCPPCNLKLTGRGHHPNAYDRDASGNLIAPPEAIDSPAPVAEVDKRRRPRA